MFRTTATASCVAAIFVLAAADSSASAQALRLGSPAPKLDIAAWVQGEPVNPAAEDFDNVLVLEFWATWCGPCRNTFPLLSTMQEEYRGDGLRIVGITREPVELVRNS